MTLQSIKEKLQTVPELSVSEVGEGKAKFLHIRSSTRGIEVAETGNKIWIEYWADKDGEDESSPVKEETVTSREEALRKIKQWLVP